MKQFYILFPNQTNGMKLNTILNDRNIKTVIAPTPRVFSSSCGISLMVKEEDIEEIKRIVKECEIEILDIVNIYKG
jgi:hypothetical protein